MATAIIGTVRPDPEDFGRPDLAAGRLTAATVPVYGDVEIARNSKVAGVADLVGSGSLDVKKDLDGALVRLAQLSTFVPSQYEGNLARTKVRPLGKFSDLVAEEAGELADLGRRGELSAMQIYAIFESKALRIKRKVIDAVASNPTAVEAQVARLDVVWAERIVSVAFEQSDPISGPSTWRGIRKESRLFDLATLFAQLEGSHPLLSWSDIASRHPILDPRSFLPKSNSRDQEVYMYRVQHAIDHGYRAVVLTLLDESTDEATVDKAVVTTESIMRLMGHLSRVRNSGEFDKLDPYLRENNQVTGHGTGAFSVWVLLATYLMMGNTGVLKRLAEPENFKAFDADAATIVEQVVSGELAPFAEWADGETRGKVAHFVKGFHAAHYAAVMKHARGSLEVAAPANLEMTNGMSMKEAIAS